MKAAIIEPNPYKAILLEMKYKAHGFITRSFPDKRSLKKCWKKGEEWLIVCSFHDPIMSFSEFDQRIEGSVVVLGLKTEEVHTSQTLSIAS